MKLPTIALVGRPNVGKSTIFNRLVGRKQAIIEDTPGVTRDRIYGTGTYLDYRFNVIDTGGIDISDDAFNKEIKMQAELAIDEENAWPSDYEQHSSWANPTDKFLENSFWHPRMFQSWMDDKEHLQRRVSGRNYCADSL